MLKRILNERTTEWTKNESLNIKEVYDEDTAIR
jgi:hypothetical protein